MVSNRQYSSPDYRALSVWLYQTIDGRLLPIIQFAGTNNAERTAARRQPRNGPTIITSEVTRSGYIPTPKTGAVTRNDTPDTKPAITKAMLERQSQ